MKDEQIVELQALIKLETEGSLDEGQKYKLEYLRDIEEKATELAEAKKTASTALAQKEHFRTKAEKEETDRKALEIKLSEKPKGETPALEVTDFIDISASLEGLDQREKEYLASQHKLTGKPLSEIRKDENFGFWQSAYRQKLEKEKALTPSGAQPEADKPVSFDEKLANATMEEKEKLLTDAGLYKEPRPPRNRTNIGPK